MYMTDEVIEEVFKETRRILKKDGELWIWDARMRPKGKIFAIRLRVVILGNREVQTAYGVRAKEQSAEHISRLLQNAGYESEVIINRKHWFMIKAHRV
jgi:hypothetical protein